MKTILHTVDIRATPEAVFEAIATEAGLAGWWTTTVEAEERIGGLIEFTFGATFNPRMKITALEAPKPGNAPAGTIPGATTPSGSRSSRAGRVACCSSRSSTRRS